MDFGKKKGMKKIGLDYGADLKPGFKKGLMSKSNLPKPTTNSNDDFFNMHSGKGMGGMGKGKFTKSKFF